MIEINNLSIAYGNVAVFKNAALKVGNGKIYGVYGKTGCGKSTLLSLLAGVTMPDSGSVRINGFDTARETVSAKRCIGYCPQYIRFDGTLTVYELLTFAADAKGVDPDRRFLHVHQIIEELALDGLRDRLISRLTPLEYCRLGLAQALVGSSEILLLDEPTQGMSRSEGRELRAYIRTLAEKGKTVFYASSEAIEINDVSDEVLILKDHTVLPATPLSELLHGQQLTLEVTGEAKKIEDALAASGMILACRPLARERETLRYSLKTTQKTSAQALCGYLVDAGIHTLSVTEEALCEEESALRRAAGTLKNVKKEEADA